ncbi:MAG TPA: FkbM family methyltransferase [Gemmata sp.]|nr:FkbM family methyltransferase [Gemmata sp.]
MDVEGLDYPILKTYDFGKYRPKVICAELRSNGRTNEEAVAFLREKGYEIQGMTFPNVIFADRAVMG